MKTSKYSTKVTRLKIGWGCRILYEGKVCLEGHAKSRLEIGPVFRDLMRTLDALGGDQYTKSCRKRKFQEGNREASIKHIWYR
jgi:hypothetical protein